MIFLNFIKYEKLIILHAIHSISLDDYLEISSLHEDYHKVLFTEMPADNQCVYN